MQLKSLLDKFTALEVKGHTAVSINDLTTDPNRVRPGSLYIALGSEGHDSMEVALGKGASVILCERLPVATHRATLVRVASTELAAPLIAAAFRGDPSQKLLTIAVMGNHDEKNVAFLLKQLLQRCGLPAGLIGSIRNEVGARILPSRRQGPDCLEAQRLMGEMVSVGLRACVVEVNPQSIARGAFSNMHFDAAVFTNFSRGPSGDDSPELRLFRHWVAGLPQSKKQICAVINVNDLETGPEPSQIQLTYGCSELAEVRASHLNLQPDRSDFFLTLGGQQFACSTPLVGRHNVCNLLAAAGAAFSLELKIPLIARALSSLTPPPGDLEVVSADAPFRVYIDSAATPEALTRVVNSLREVTSNHLRVVIGCAGSVSSEARFQLGETLASLADFALLTADNPGKENPEEICRHLAAGFSERDRWIYQVETDRREAIRLAIEQAEPGDSILIAGKGGQTYQELADTIVPFDDREHAAECIEQAGLSFAVANGSLAFA